jgi:Flp pilus assembly protein TadG
MKLIARSHEPRPAALGRPAADRRAFRRNGSRGQVLVIFAGAAFVLFALMALVIDVSWYWANTLKVQRAADAAALAGVVWLPSKPSTANTVALTEATKNGYTNGSGGVTITAVPDPADDRQLDVAVSAPVGTFFMRLIGVQSITASRTAKAKFVLPVPMGSPLNYLGVGCFRTKSGTQPLCTTAGNSNGLSGIPNGTVSSPSPLTGSSAPSQMPSQGFFDSAITKGGDSGNGDAYDPTADSANVAKCQPNPPGTLIGTNGSCNPAGVYYEVVIPVGDTNGSVYVFDPGYCAVDASYGTGDHWIDKGKDGSSQGPVSTYYNLWDTNDNVYATSNFTLVTASGSKFEQENQSDNSSDLGGPGSLPVCGDPSGANPLDTYHNKWWQMTTGLVPGVYYLQVTTTKVLTTNGAYPLGNGGQTPDPLGSAINTNTNAENMFSLEVTATGSGGTPQVYGAGTMVAYNNVNGGDQQFYLAQIPKSDAGKTLEIDLFDIGDVSKGGAATLYVQSPDGNKYTNATFDFQASSPCGSSCSGSGVSSILATDVNGNHPYNDSWLTIRIALPSTYGSVGLTPSGEPGAGWWKIDYKISAGVQSNDTTTWRVSVLGKPVHLIVP